MAETPSQRRDRLARERGYKNYLDYRNKQAQQLGYRNYYEQRRARATGVGIRPGDVRATAPRIRPRLVEPVTTDPFLGLADLRSGYQTSEALIQSRSYDDILGRSRGARTLAAERVATQRLSEMSTRARYYYEYQFPEIYKAGALAIDPEYVLTAADRSEISKLQSEGLTALTQAHRYTLRSAKRISALDEDYLANLSSKRLQGLAEKFVRGARYSDGTQRTLGDYADMSLNTTANRAYNLATLRAGGGRGVVLWEVSDGSACGWTSHHDPEKANGKIVTAEEAFSFPLAHPHCVRRFSPRIDLDKRDYKKVAKQAAVVVSVAALAAQAGTIIGAQQGVQDAIAAVAARANPAFAAFDENIKRLVTQAIQLRRPIGQLFDFETGLPIIQSRAQAEALLQRQVFTAEDLADDVAQYADEWAFDPSTALPDHVYDVLGLEGEAQAARDLVARGVLTEREAFFPLRKVVGDRFQEFSDYYSARYRYLDSDIFKRTNDLLHLEQRAIDALQDFVRPLGNRFGRFSLPRVGRGEGKFLAPRGTIDPTGLTRVTTTRTRKGFVNRLAFNRNGLVRAGFRMDPETGRVFPTFRLIPKGPLRIATKINRGVKGNITSLSAEVRLITRLPVNFSASFNINLRALGLDTWQDIKNLRLADFRRMGLDDVKFISTAAELRIRGYNMFELARVFRVTAEDAKKLWQLAEKKLVDIGFKYTNFFKAQGVQDVAFFLHPEETQLIQQFYNTPEIFNQLTRREIDDMQLFFRKMSEDAYRAAHRITPRTGPLDILNHISATIDKVLRLGGYELPPPPPDGPAFAFPRFSGEEIESDIQGPRSGQSHYFKWLDQKGRMRSVLEPRFDPYLGEDFYEVPGKHILVDYSIIDNPEWVGAANAMQEAIIYMQDEFPEFGNFEISPDRFMGPGEGAYAFTEPPLFNTIQFHQYDVLGAWDTTLPERLAGHVREGLFKPYEDQRTSLILHEMAHSMVGQADNLGPGFMLKLSDLMEEEYGWSPPLDSLQNENWTYDAVDWPEEYKHGYYRFIDAADRQYGTYATGNLHEFLAVVFTDAALSPLPRSFSQKFFELLKEFYG